MNAPPLLVSYSSLDEYLSALDSELQEQYSEQIQGLVNKNLPPIVSVRCLALLFGYNPKFINSMIIRNTKYYRSFTIRSKNKKRIIYAPRVSLKVIQKWFGFHLSRNVTFGNDVYGFIPGKSAAGAASRHCNARWVYSVDIKDFFPSTTDAVIKDSLQSIGYSEHASDIITSLNCFGDRLAQGSPSSPVISNLVLKNVDEQLASIAQRFGVRYTRYADDIVFSGPNVFNNNIKDNVQSLFENTCWELSSEKEYFSQLPKRLKVHGLLVDGDVPRLTKGYRNKIRAFKHLLKNRKVKERDLPRIKGHVEYADSIEERNND